MINSDITCIVLTKNEEVNIVNCLKSITCLAERIIVVDSGSTDRTVEIAKKMGAEVFSHEFLNYANQFNWALDNTSINTKWVYRIDADEFVSQELCQEILSETKKHNSDNVNGIVMKFKIVFMGKWLKHGGNYPFLNLTIFKFGFGRYSERMMGEHIEISEGKIISLSNPCDHNDFKTLNVWINKHNWYSTREVIDYFERMKGKNATNYYKLAKKTSSLRDKIYYKLPKFFRAHLFFIFRYYFLLGFLDGKRGKIYCWLQAYWYRFLVDAKIYEFELTNKYDSNPGDLK